MLLKSKRLRWLLAVCLAVTLAACGGKGGSDGNSSTGGGSGTGGGGGGGGTGGGGGGGSGGSQTGRTFLIKPGDSATTDMIGAMVQAAPGDVIQFDCGYFELSSTLLLTHTEDVKVKGCGRDKTVLSFKNNNSPEGILADTVGGITVEDLTVLDTGGNGIELRNVSHGTLRRVRAIWSSNGGRESPDPITAANYASRLHVPCTDPPTLNPNAPENQYPGADTHSPDYTVSEKSGRYGIYPVASENILIEDTESIGASDAGIYVGQTNNAIIRNSRAAYNVFGMEIENVQAGEYDSNIAECNTGGFLIYDADNLRQYGDRSRMFKNIARNNNTYNFTAGGFVANVPPGSGMITLSYDRIDVFENLFENNNTGGIIHASYELFPEGVGRPSDRRIDWYSEGVHIFRNTFRNNGNGLPVPTTTDLENQDLARLLPPLVGLKNQAACLDPRNAAVCGAATAGLISETCNGADETKEGADCAKAALGFRGGHIVWDGLLDSYHADCPYPTVDGTQSGTPVPKDARGKPLSSNAYANPSCLYNAYKFEEDEPHPRIVPDWFASCIDDDNVFSSDSIIFANFHGLAGLEAVIAAATASPDESGLAKVLTALPTTNLQNFASSFDISPHKCVAAYGKNLDSLPPVVIPPFVRSGDYDPQPSEAVVAQICGAAVPAGQVNHDATAVNCPTLDQYHLFSDPEDPTSAPNGRSVPFALNSKLFSDYAVKYRVLFLPLPTSESSNAAIYRDSGGHDENVTISFPAGTVIAKTFAFADEGAGTVTPAETRLLIKRVNSKGVARWDGVPYIWGTDENGKRVARLAMGGGTASVSWNLHDVDSNQVHAGSTSKYAIPHANQCLSCHANKDADSGSAPIGPKVRFLNRPYHSEVAGDTSEQASHAVEGENQIAYWCQNGLLDGCPDDLGVDADSQIATGLERIPAFNKPGDSGFVANSPEDIEKRARAWIEVNCQHCHNEKGFASTTGLFLDSLRAVDTNYGICKHPIATGLEGSGGRTVDIHPGNIANSIMEYRIGPDATTPAARMPPLARSVVDEEGHALVAQWIQNVITRDDTKYPGSTSCGN